MRGVLILVLGLAAHAQSPPIEFTQVVTGLRQPVHLAHAGDGTGRLYVVEQAGSIRVVENGALRADAFLDITPRVSCCGERGLLGVAFPPGYADKRYFYVYYTDLAGDITVSRFRLRPDSAAADPSSETILLSIPHRQFGNHNGGQLVFGPDGYLYIGTGDGGGGGDPFNSGQSINTLLGKILRIDVESGAVPYAIPPTNPFVNRSGSRGEIWAYGLRNPWRFSFDRATNDLYIADVGQNQYEEVNYQPASSRGGENYGWNIMEGAHCFRPGCSTENLVSPVAEYSHGTGDCSITGGFVYSGPRFPQLRGTYFYGDYCTGRLWTLRRSGAAWQVSQPLDTDMMITSFGEDEAGEQYVVDHNGSVFRIGTPGNALSSDAVVNAAAYQPGLVPGSLAIVFGSGLTTATGIVSAQTTPLPRNIEGTSLLINGVEAPLLAVASVNGLEQVNFQAPFELQPGRATVAVNLNGQPAQSVEVEVLAAQPALFTTDGARAAALHPDYRPVLTEAPARRGEVIQLYATGLGQVENPPPTGTAAPLSPLAPTLVPPVVTIGGVAAAVHFSGLAPGAVGQYQLNIEVPAGAPSGEQDVILAIGGISSRPVKLSVE